MSMGWASITLPTVWPLMSMPRICRAVSSAAAGSAASFTPPALPRPPVFTWALTTTRPPSPRAIPRACLGESVTSALGTTMPCDSKSSLAWCSYRSIPAPVWKVPHAPWTPPTGCGITSFIQYSSTVCNLPRERCNPTKGQDFAMPDDTQDAISGGHLVAKALKAEGVDRIYTLCGGHIIDIYDGCVDEGIDVVDVRHEQVAAHAADGWARITGTPGCAVVTAGPGTTDAVTGVANALRAESPMLLIGG